MDKNKLKKFAAAARNDLRLSVRKRLRHYGIDGDDARDAARNGEAYIVHNEIGQDLALSAWEGTQHGILVDAVRRRGLEAVIEEVAYTIFNRLIAIRYMEINDYLPTHERVLSGADGGIEPEIVTLAPDVSLDLTAEERERAYTAKDENRMDELFRFLFFKQCEELGTMLPGLFTPAEGYVEMLCDLSYLDADGVIRKLILLGEEDFQDQVAIIGWMYQYYNADQNDLVYDGSMSKSRIPKELLSAATTIYTPDWPVRYMVENSLGRLWLEGHPNDELKANWKYYLDEVQQEPEVETQLAEIRKEYSALTPEQIRCIDPCSGSGHICAYLFDVLVQIYEVYGYTVREAVKNIIENNLCGLDIDERAAQLAYFSMMMKAVQYDSRFLRRKGENGKPSIPQPHIYSIKESNYLDKEAVEYFCDGDVQLTKEMNTLIAELHDAKEYGSILNVSQVDFAALYVRFDEVDKENTVYRENIKNELLPFVQCAEAMAQK